MGLVATIIIMETVSGSSRTHTLTDVQENSDYVISITARNTAGDSPPAMTMETTAIAGILHCTIVCTL